MTPALLIPFDFQPRTRIIFGPETVDRLGDLAGELGARRVLLVSDPGVVAAGHTACGIASLQRAGIACELFDQVSENPTTDHVDHGVQVAKRFDPELIVGFGGGSSMDCAKGINFVYTNGGRMQDYWGIGKALRPMLPMIAVPTTAGTGSETQSFALISDAKTHAKMACGDKKASFRIAILDPCLTITQPPLITALTGIDAIAHAVETFVTKPRNPVSLVFSLEGWRLLSRFFPVVLEQPDHLEARGAMQLGACYAGMAIENSMLGAAHALANPLTATFGTPHGQAVATMLPHVVRYNSQVCGEQYRQLWQASGGGTKDASTEEAIEALVAFLDEIRRRAGIHKNLEAQGANLEQLPQLAADAARQWTGSFNPREIDEKSLLELYEAAFA